METTECGKSFISLNSTNPEHTLTWPIGLATYRPNSRCDWTIEVPDAEQIDIHFEKFDLEDAVSDECSNDYLKLTDEDVIILCVFCFKSLCNNNNFADKSLQFRRFGVPVHFFGR